jgi:hypothetical protein
VINLRQNRRRITALVLTISLLMIWELPEVAFAVPKYVETVNYNITVSLDDAISTLSGQEIAMWTNRGTASTSEIYLHLYPNAFREGSTFLKESGGRLRSDRMSRDGYGEMNLLSLQMAGQDLNWEYVQPDDGNKNDRTLARVSLPEPVAPGQSIRLTMSFAVQLPDIFARMGKCGQFAMVGQWFPKVAVYESAGTRGRTADGWDQHQYHGNSEFYADFGHYQVTILVPKDHTVAATGQLASGPKEINGKRQYVFVADRVHDFAWATDDDFVYKSATLQSASQPALKVQLYLQPEHEQLSDFYFQAARETINRLSEWFAPYPYPVLSLVNPTSGASGAGGMEYPTLVTGWDSSLQGADAIYTVLVHEIIHQYFYGLVASNEFEEAWLDEGFTSYIEDKVMSEAFGRTVDPAVEATSVQDPQSLVLDAWNYHSAYSYQSNVYTRGKLILHEIERQIGWEQLRAVLRQYVNDYFYRHPSTRDFQSVLEQVTGHDWGAFFDAYVYGQEMQDLAIERVNSKVLDGGYETTVDLVQPLAEPHQIRLLANFNDSSSQVYDLEINQTASEYTFPHQLPLSSLELDPLPYQVILDNNRMNNYYAVRLTSRWSLWLSYFLHLLSQWIGW